ncbi:MAG: HEPN domain-containing protein [Planctomycetes bacterium]|nr:HEPN domain-containing protein [Planctomycetota bacterium]
MSEERLRELIRLRMAQAAETLHEAQILLAEHAGRGAANRAYYTMFYAVLAVLATKGLGSSKHSGTISLFDREFVKSGDLPKELSRALHMAFERGQQADYGELIRLDEPVATRTVEEAEMFVQKVRDYLTARGLLPSDP